MVRAVNQLMGLLEQDSKLNFSFAGPKPQPINLLAASYGFCFLQFNIRNGNHYIRSDIECSTFHLQRKLFTCLLSCTTIIINSISSHFNNNIFYKYFYPSVIVVLFVREIYQIVKMQEACFFFLLSSFLLLLYFVILFIATLINFISFQLKQFSTSF